MMTRRKAGQVPSTESTPRRIEIYGLFCPDTGLLRYIGKANDSRKRLKAHIQGCERRLYASAKWISDLKANGKTPTLQVMTYCGAGEWQDMERLLIAKHRALGCDLLNVTPGGDEVQRDHRRWQFLRHLGGQIKYFRDAGNAALVLKLELVKALFHESKKDTQDCMLDAFMRRNGGVKQ